MIFCLLTFHLSWVYIYSSTVSKINIFSSFFLHAEHMCCMPVGGSSICAKGEGLLVIHEVLMARQGGLSFTPGPNILLWRIKISPNLVTA